MTDEGTKGPPAPASWPSVEDVKPDEEGGPNARRGFNYQDEIAVSFLIEMLEDSMLVKVHCETHDDIVLIRANVGQNGRGAEYVQVKASEQDKLWSVADLCQRKKKKPGTSIFEISLGRDKHREASSFRLVTLRPVVNTLVIEELGSVRLRFERERLSGELQEADELLDVLCREHGKLSREVSDAEETLRTIERELAPARRATAALVQEDVSAIDVTLGQASERERQIRRISAALEVGSDLTKKIDEFEKQIEPLQERVDHILSATDFDAAASRLEDGMNDYLNAINFQRPDVWRHSPVNVDVSRSGFTMRVGRRRWSAALGGTDTLYFLMAYHYGLLTLSDKARCHYPGLTIIDLPGEFSGEAIEDKENFIVQPFIDLLSRDEYQGAQLVITGASFVGLEGAHLQRLTHVHVA